MIKTTLTRPVKETKELEFPIIMHNPETGTILRVVGESNNKEGLLGFQVNENSTSLQTKWPAEMFKIYEGSITLENEL